MHAFKGTSSIALLGSQGSSDGKKLIALMHRNCLERCRLGTSLRDVHHYSIRLASEGIADLRLLSNRSASSISRDAYRQFYPHSVGTKNNLPAFPFRFDAKAESFDSI